MDNKILDMFAKSTFAISKEKYIYAKVKTMPVVGDHFMVSKDRDEITVVTREDSSFHLDLVEKNNNLWRLVSLNLNTPFMAGTLATINTACFKKGLNNLIVSTYSKDYIIVKDTQVNDIREVLKSLGFKEEP
jgi:hypothetical protein